MTTNTWSYSEAENAAMRGDPTFVTVERGYLENLKENKEDAQRLRMTLEKVENRCQVLQWRQTQGDKLINETMYRENREMNKELQNLKKVKRKLEIENEDLAWRQFFIEQGMSSVETNKQKRRKKRGQGRVNKRRCET